MNFLLDTSVFIWARSFPERLNRRARELLSLGSEPLYLSAASSWEIGVKYPLGKLELPDPPRLYVPEAMNMWGIRALDISHRHALSVAELPLHHSDPFDRILIAQARVERMALLTADRMFENYDVEIIWCGG
jgi:PIN domain nuclease of toxin-antitoxin system